MKKERDGYYGEANKGKGKGRILEIITEIKRRIKMEGKSKVKFENTKGDKHNGKAEMEKDKRD